MIPFRLVGPLSLYTGYTVGFRGLARMLAKRPDLDIDLRGTKWNCADGIEPELLELVKQPKNHDRLGVGVGYGTVALQLGTRRRVIYTMYEADDIPQEWKIPVREAHEVWVPSTFCARVFGKYNKRVRIVPWGIDTAVYRRGKSRKSSGDFVFGAVGVQSPRKGTDVMVEGFRRAFGGRSGVRLVIKTRDTRSLPPIGDDRITVIDEDWPEERLVQFYRDIDCLVEPSRGEGIGMPPLQAAMCGTPALVTNWGGTADLIDDKGIWGVRIKGLVRASNTMAKGARWAEPDAGHLAELMEWVVDERPKVKGDYSRWSLQSQADHFVEYLRYSWRDACR